MNVLIIEDESLAAERMTQLLSEYDPNIKILAILDSIKNTIHWLNTHKHPDLIFMDIQLADGLSFEIFEHTEVRSPVIFTTAYDEYAIRAFKVNSIDYLLKPIDLEEIKSAFEKYYSFYQKSYCQLIPDRRIIDQMLRTLTQKHKSRFLIKIGERFVSIHSKDILYFYSQDKMTYLCTHNAKNYIIDYTLEQLQNLIDPADFFRINRKYIVHSRSIKNIVIHSNSRLKIDLHFSKDNDIIVSRKKVPAFKQWLGN